MIKILMLAALIAPTAKADTTTQSEGDAPSVIAQIIPQAVDGRVSSECILGNCVLVWTPQAGPAVFTDKKAVRQALVAELAGLEDKLDAGTITAAEQRRALKIILKLMRLSKDAN